MKCLLWEHCPVSIQKTTAFVGLVTQKEAFWWTAYRRKHWTQCAALAAHKKQQLNREAIPLRKTKICICGFVSGGFANKKGCRSNAPRADDSWECDCGSMREQAWLIHTHTHTHSLARTAVADVVSVEHLTLYQRVLIIDFQKSEESFQLFLFQCIRAGASMLLVSTDRSKRK